MVTVCRRRWPGETRRARAIVLAAGLIACLTAVPGQLDAQGSSATLSGTVVDDTGAVLPGATVAIVNPSTGLHREMPTNADGSFTFPLLLPARYVLTARLTGFVPLEISDIVLNVNDRVALTVRLKVEAVGESVTVTAPPAQSIRTSPAVGTVIDRQFVENLPLNGRSFHSLLELTPGVVLTNVGHPSLEGGQFSVNGQRSNSNYFTVDGVSANAGISSGLGHSASGQLPALTALGGTNGLVSVDALQEFRIQTSSYAPEFGRTPGGQISLVTRSGTNAFHGTASYYFRDESMDATDWFTNSLGQPKPQLNQHNFGGVLGGPIFRNRTFFFGSYDGLRLDQPRAVVIGVPTVESRRAAPSAFQPYLDALPIPNGKDLGNGAAEFAASYSDPSRVDASSVRIDHTVGSGLTLFGRVSHAPSSSSARLSTGLSSVRTTHQDNDSVTIGSTWIASSQLVHDLRVNYTTNFAPVFSQPDDFGGAVPLPLTVFAPGRTPERALFALLVDYSVPVYWGNQNGYEQRQLNIVDSVTLTRGSHEWKVGVDFRRIDPLVGGGSNPVGHQVLALSLSSLKAGLADDYNIGANAVERRRVAFDNFSLYAQDNWRVGSRLTLTYGLRWELVPPPHTESGQESVTVENLDDPYGGQARLAARGTALWKTRYNNFAPRVGASYIVSSTPGAETVVKGAFGIFHDLGFGQVANGFVNYPFTATKVVGPTTLPLPADAIAAPQPGDTPPSFLYLMDRNLELPRTYQWNVSVERSLGARHTLTLSYVGAAGRGLLKADRYNVSLRDWPTMVTGLIVNRNRGHSDYGALQVQYQRRLQHGFQSIVSYTLGRSRDTSSSDYADNIAAELLPPEVDYGYSDYDVRHVLTAALTYQVPELRGSSLWHAAARDWGLDMMLRARSAFPINVFTVVPFPPELTVGARPNVVSGQPFWIEDASVPGGRRLNRQAFTKAPPGTQGDLVRGSVRGFNASQVDLAVRRDFRLRPGLRLQLRFEMFNLLNTPNFADPSGNLDDSTFGVATQMLNRGLGGLSALYQIGGPRSTQIAVKVLF